MRSHFQPSGWSLVCTSGPHQCCPSSVVVVVHTAACTPWQANCLSHAAKRLHRDGLLLRAADRVMQGSLDDAG
jgi:hypothetical protein